MHACDTFEGYLDHVVAGEGKMIKEYIWGFDKDWFGKKTIPDWSPPIPTMKEVRGKIVILQKFPDKCGDKPCDLEHTVWDRYYGLPENHNPFFYIQDEYNFDKIKEYHGDLANNMLWKWNYIKTYLINAAKRTGETTDEIVINCLNGVYDHQPR